MLIDYQKAYDSVPHLWVNKILELYNIGVVKQGLMNQLMPSWWTQLKLPHAGGVIKTEDVYFKQGIFKVICCRPSSFASPWYLSLICSNDPKLVTC